nr:hypothetical protein CFP56_09584 [Quercus suber]
MAHRRKCLAFTRKHQSQFRFRRHDPPRGERLHEFPWGVALRRLQFEQIVDLCTMSAVSKHEDDLEMIGKAFTLNGWRSDSDNGKENREESSAHDLW